MNKRDSRHLERERLLFRYSSALQRGDFATVESVLLEAQHDPALDDLIADLNAAYETELNAAHTILSNDRPYREDQPVTITLNRTAVSMQNTRRTPFTLGAAVLAVAVMSVLLLALRSGGQMPSNLAAVEQSLSPTPSSTPLPATACPPTLVPTTTPMITASPSMDGILLTATAIVAEATMLAQQPCFPPAPEIATLIPSDTSNSSGTLPITGTIASLQAVNVREGPGLNFNPIQSLLPGTVVAVLGQSADGLWLNIRMGNGQEGWIASDLVRLNRVSNAVSLPATACPPTLVPTATPMIAASPPMDGILLTATAIVAEATMLAQQPCFPPAPEIAMQSLAPTPTAALIGAGAATAVLVEDVNGIAAGTLVSLTSAYFNGAEWIYQVTTLDGAGSAEVRESQFAPAVEAMLLEPTVVPPACSPDQVINVSSRLLEIYSSPSQGSTVIGTLTPGNIATVVNSEVQANNQTWLLISIEITESRITGWIPANSVNSVPCAAVGTVTPPAPAESLECIISSFGDPLLQVKNEPSSSAMNIGVVPSSLLAYILRQERGSDGYIWYFISAQMASASITGWVRQDSVAAVHTCPRLNDATSLPSTIAPPVIATAISP